VQNKELIIICHITTVHSAYDDRIFYKEILSLKEQGYEMHWVVPHGQNEIIQGVHIHALPEYKNRLKRLLAGNLRAFCMARRTHSSVCHFHDPELMYCGTLLWLCGRKVIYDVHEDLPKQVLYKEWIKSKSIKSIFSFLIQWFEAFSCLFFKGIIAATEDIAVKFPKRKTVVIRNYPVLGLINNSAISGERNKEFTMVYAGGLTRIRGIFEMIEAIGLQNGKCKLILMGEFDDNDYRAKCEKSSGWNYTNYVGKVKPDEVFQYIAKADAGFAMLYPVKNYLTSLPVKAFEYMAMGKPMIMSDFVYWKTLFDGCALFADPLKPESINNAITQMKDERENALNMGKEGLKKVLSEMSWEKEKETLLLLYNRILKNGNPLH